MALLRQVASDLAAADRVYDAASAGTYCQVIAKFQQAVEKSIKALVAALAYRGHLSMGTGYSHNPEKLMSALVHLPGSKKDKGVQTIQQHVDHALSPYRWGEIRALCSLVPTRPDPGQPR